MSSDTAALRNTPWQYHASFSGIVEVCDRCLHIKVPNIYNRGVRLFPSKSLFRIFEGLHKPAARATDAERQ